MRFKKELRNYEITFNSKWGKVRTAIATFSVVSYNRNNDVGLAFVIHDVIERKGMKQKPLKASLKWEHNHD